MNIKKKKIVGIIGASFLGTDPYHDKSWSGSSAFFFNECKVQGILSRAFGVDAPFIKKKSLMLSNFRFNLEKWKQNFFLDTRYYDALTSEIRKSIKTVDLDCNFLQIGGVFDTPEVVQGRTKCFSYHDGNLRQFLKSPFFPKGISSKRIDAALKYEKRIYHSIDKIFTMSEYLRQSFIDDFDVNEKKVVNIGAGINLKEIPQITSRQYDNCNILFIGVDFMRKGGMDLLKAFKRVKDVLPKAMLHIVGPPQLNLPYELAGNVIHYGFLSKNIPEQRRVLDNLFNKVVLFVMPSRYEPFGIAPLEAMAHQIPCILADKWAFPEMVTPGKEGELVAVGNTKELAEKILTLLQSPDVLENMGEASRVKVLKKYTWNHVVTKFIRNI